MYEKDERFINELIEDHANFEEHILINGGKPVQFSCVLCDGGKDQEWRFE